MITPRRGQQKGGNSASDQALVLRQKAVAAKQAKAAGIKLDRGKTSTAFNKQAKAWQAGAVGEERVARQLARLSSSEGRVLNDRLLDPPKQWNLDHLVIAPMGVLFVDAKNWKGDLTVYQSQLWRHYTAGPKVGRKSVPMTSEVKKVFGMAEKATQRLGFPIRPVICLAGSRSKEFEQEHVVSGVTIVSHERLARWIRDSRPVVSPANIELLYAAAAKIFPPATAPLPLSEFEQRLRGTT